jgi:hypothetical protein
MLEIKPVESLDQVLELALLEPHPARPVAVRAGSADLPREIGGAR